MQNIHKCTINLHTDNNDVYFNNIMIRNKYVSCEY